MAPGPDPRPRAGLFIGLVVAAAAGCGSESTGPPSPPPPPPSIELAVEVVVAGLSFPVHLTAPTGDDRLFVVEQVGLVSIIRDGQRLATPFLDIRDRVRMDGEQGLFSIAFHPDYATNGRFFVSYTGLDGDSRLERWAVSGDPDRADPASDRLLLEISQPRSNHNGGQIAFGPDRMLYASFGDGGGGGDPFGNGQDPGTLLGTILRLDVDAADPFAIPPDNPFVGIGGFRDEIWAWGLRNPWRFSFDLTEEVIYVADVGQSDFEEVNAAPASAAGLNYGWNTMEAAHCFGAATCNMAGLTLPVVEYDHDDGCSVVGGFVYRGAALADLAGHYFYSDFCTGFLRSFRLEGGVATEERQWDVGDLGRSLSFGEDAAGELYVLSLNGRIYRLVAAN